MTEKQLIQIAEIMGWKVLDPEYSPCQFSGKLLYGVVKVSFNLNYWEAVKSMQARMVADGWSIQNFAYTTYFEASATRSDPLRKFLYAGADQEQTAIAGLFCKVYGIEEE